MIAHRPAVLRRLQAASSLALLSLLWGCSTPLGGGPVDAPADGPSPDVAADVPSPDVALDGPVADASPTDAPAADRAPPDAAQPDGAPPDADASTDAVVVASPDRKSVV